MTCRHRAHATIIVAASAVIAISAHAQSASTDSGQLQEIVVTANRRSQNSQEVPVAITAISEAQLKQDGVTSTTQIAQFTPGLQVFSPNSGTDNFYSIRGATQNDYGEHEESPVAVYIDGVYMSQAAGTSALLFDTSNVQVLRGPQGTLFGRNATAGLVQYTSNAPTFDTDGYAEFSYGSYGDERIEGALGTGLTDNLAFRFSFAQEHQDPYLRNILVPSGDNPGNDNNAAGRLQLLWKPLDGLEMTTNIHGTGTHNHAGFYKQLVTYSDPNNHNLGTSLTPNSAFQWGNGPAGSDLAGLSPPAGLGFYDGTSTLPGHNIESTMGATETVKYRFGQYTITSITDFTKYNKDYNEDSASTTQLEATFWTGVNTSQFSQELHIDNGSADRWRWVAGTYYLNMTGRYIEGNGSSPTLINNYANYLATPDCDVNCQLSGLTTGITSLNQQDNYKINTSSWSVFQQSEYDIFSDLTATFGLRWSQENKSMDQYVYDMNGGTQGSGYSSSTPVYVFNTGTFGDFARLSKGDWSGKISLSYKLTEDVIPYISLNKGIKSGGFNNVPSYYVPPEGEKFNEEKVYDLEAGVKTELLDHHLRINADVFYYDYKGYQAFNTIGIGYLVTNNPAHMVGGEMDMQYSPLKGLVFRNGLALLHAEIQGISLPDGTVASRQTAQAPHANFTGSVDYDWQQNWGTVTIGTDYSWRSDFFFDILNDPISHQSAYWLQNIHLSYLEPDGNWEFRWYIDNVWNQQYLTNVVQVASEGWSQGTVGMPLTTGFRLSYHL